MSTSSSFRYRFSSALRETMWFVRIYVGWFLLATALTGGENLKYFHRPLWVILLLYGAGGVAIAVFIALVRPWATTRFRGYLAGAVIGLPLTVAILVVLRPHFTFQILAISALTSALILTGPYGAIMWEPWKDQKNKTRGGPPCEICEESSGRHLPGCPGADRR